jgi:hypothetical protein
MNQMFTIPQFIDVESKIIGALTVRQFIISLAGLILIGACYKLLEFWTFVVVGLFIFAITGAFAFVKINGRPFHFFVLNFIQTSAKPNLRVWNHRIINKGIDEEKEGKQFSESNLVPAKPKPSASRLNELSLIIDTQGTYRGENQGNVRIVKEKKDQKQENEE